MGDKDWTKARGGGQGSDRGRSTWGTLLAAVCNLRRQDGGSEVDRISSPYTLSNLGIHDTEELIQPVS